jgi:hypothetical protein
MDYRGCMVGVVAVGLLLTACTAHESAPPPREATVVEPLGERVLCGDHLKIDFKTGDEMRAGVPGLESDERVEECPPEASGRHADLRAAVGWGTSVHSGVVPDPPHRNDHAVD